MFDFIKTGGTVGVSIIIIFGITSVVLFGVGLNYLLSKKSYKTEHFERIREYILLFGSLSFLTGCASQLLGFYEAFIAIKEAADIAPYIVMEGFLVSCIAPLCGLTFLSLSFVLWYVLKMKKSRI